MFGKEKIKKDYIAVIFDVGSASVGGALVLFSENKKPRVLYNVRRQMILQDEMNAETFVSTMLRTLNSVISNVENKGLVHLNFLKMKNKEIEEAFCFLSSPWVVSQTRIIEMAKSKPFLVTNKLMKSLVENDEKEFLNSDLEKYKDILGKKDEISILDEKIIQVRLNGYTVNNPHKKEVKNIKIFIFTSLLAKQLSEKIKKAINKNFNVEQLNLHSFLLPTFLTIRDVFDSKDDFIFLDVSGEATDISFVKDDVLMETQTFPVGKKAFIKEIMKSFKVTNEIAVSLLKTYNAGQTETRFAEKIKGALNDTGKKWVKFLEDGMLDLSQGSILPKTIFILADDEIGEIIKKIIEKDKFTKLVFPGYNKTSNPILINCDQLARFCVFDNRSEKDVFLGLESIFINKIFDLS
ncbi:hypothetical protein KKG48_02430 [Patescibacteria group bacterium]|nr:hypothetical protein [Patescibacteria group bacterium]MCG2694545.1 hypothetical protein [Candidatus Parcubacteria bacterium]